MSATRYHFQNTPFFKPKVVNTQLQVTSPNLTTNAVVCFSGPTNRFIKETPVLLDDSGQFYNAIVTDASNTVEANYLQTTGNAVQVSTSAPPTPGQVLTTISSTEATWQNLPLSSNLTTPGAGNTTINAIVRWDDLIGETVSNSGVLVVNGNEVRNIRITDSSNTVTANNLRSTTTTINVSNSAAPTDADFVLVADNDTAATWQALPDLIPVLGSSTNQALALWSGTDMINSTVTVNNNNEFSGLTITDASNTVYGSALKTLGADVSVLKTLPSTGHVLQAVNLTSAQWSAPYLNKPASGLTENSLVRFGATPNILLGSDIVVDDSGNVTGATITDSSNIITADQLITQTTHVTITPFPVLNGPSHQLVASGSTNCAWFRNSYYARIRAVGAFRDNLGGDRAYYNMASFVATSGAWVTDFDYSPNSNMTDVDNSRIFCRKTGIYYFEMSALCSGKAGPTDNLNFGLRENGSPIPRTYNLYPLNSTLDTHKVLVGTTYICTAGNYYDFTLRWGFHTMDIGYNNTDLPDLDTRFSMILLPQT